MMHATLRVFLPCAGRVPPRVALALALGRAGRTATSHPVAPPPAMAALITPRDRLRLAGPRRARAHILLPAEAGNCPGGGCRCGAVGVSALAPVPRRQRRHHPEPGGVQRPGVGALGCAEERQAVQVSGAPCPGWRGAASARTSERGRLPCQGMGTRAHGRVRMARRVRMGPCAHAAVYAGWLAAGAGAL